MSLSPRKRNKKNLLGKNTKKARVDKENQKPKLKRVLSVGELPDEEEEELPDLDTPDEDRKGEKSKNSANLKREKSFRCVTFVPPANGIKLAPMCVFNYFSGSSPNWTRTSGRT